MFQPKRVSAKKRAIVFLSPALDKSLDQYATAANAEGIGRWDNNSLTCAVAVGAASLGILAGALPAYAKIVYTPANVTLKRYFTPIDLNHDGNVDFTLWQRGGATTSLQTYFLSVYSNKQYGNAVMVPPRDQDADDAAALRRGAKIGPKGKFTSNFARMALVVARGNSQHHTTQYYGQWANGGKGVKGRYLGLKFKINGKYHFGWARLSTAPLFHDVLTGYAYETVPNKPIVAGQTKGREQIESQPTPATLRLPRRKPATLGQLALGALPLSIWRREELEPAGN